MDARTANVELLKRYAEAINPEDLRDLGQVRGLFGIFAGSVSPAYFQADRRVMVVGREPRGWDEAEKDGKRGLAKAAFAPDVTGYLASMMEKHGRCVQESPPTSKFFQFYRQVQRHVARSSESGSVAWGNLLCISHNKGSPVTGLKKSEECQLAKVCEWSRALLRAQIELLQPEIIFFVTSPSYDRFLKAFIEIEADAASRTVWVPKELWQFKAHGATAFRTRHPRVLKSSVHRKDAIRRALASDRGLALACTARDE